MADVLFTFLQIFKRFRPDFVRKFFEFLVGSDVVPTDETGVGGKKPITGYGEENQLAFC